MQGISMPIYIHKYAWMTFAFLCLSIAGSAISLASDRVRVSSRDDKISLRLSGLPDDLKQKIRQCFDIEIAQFSPTREFNGPRGHADCRPASLPLCNHTSDAKDLSYRPDRQWRIVGQPSLIPVSVNGGWFSAVTVGSDRRSVGAFALCSGTGCGGPGQWAEGYLVGSEQRVPTDDERKRTIGICFNRIVRGQ